MNPHPEARSVLLPGHHPQSAQSPRFCILRHEPPSHVGSRVARETVGLIDADLDHELQLLDRASEATLRREGATRGDA